MRPYKFDTMLISFVKLLYHNSQFKYKKDKNHRVDQGT